MASWKDNLTDEEVAALYKYKTQGKDALTDAEVPIVYKYKQYLSQPTDNSGKSAAMRGLEAIEPSAPPTPERQVGTLEKIAAPIEAGVALATSPLSGVGNIVGAAGELLGQGKAEDIAGNINKWLPHPTTELGKEYTDKLGKILDPLNAVMPNLSMMHALGTPILNRPPLERLRPEDVVSREPTQTPTGKPLSSEGQMELDVARNKYGIDSTKLQVDENGIPINREASLEAQATSRGGDLFEGQLPEQRQLPPTEADLSLSERVPSKRNGVDVLPQDQGIDYWKTPEQISLALEEHGGQFFDPSWEKGDGLVNEKTAGDYVREWKAKQAEQTVPFDTSTETPLQGQLPLGGTGKRGFGQGGAIDPQVFLEGIKKLGRTVEQYIPKRGDRLTLKDNNDNYFIVDSIKENSRGEFFVQGTQYNKEGIQIGHGQLHFSDFKELASIGQKLESGKLLGGPGKKQGGGWTPFADMFPEKAKEQQVKKAFNNLPWAKQIKLTGDVIPFADLVQRIKESGLPDLQKLPGNVKQWFTSSGRLQRDLIDHPVVSNIYNAVTKAKEWASEQARISLDHTDTGIFPYITKNILKEPLRNIAKGFVDMKAGRRQVEDVLQWRLRNEGIKTVEPKHWTPEQRELNARFDAQNKKLISAINDVLVSAGKKPIVELPQHFVHYWSGPYRAYVYVKTEGGRKLGWYLSENSPKDMAAARKWVQEKMGDKVEITPTTFVKSDIRNKSSMLDHLLEISQNKDPEIQAAMEAFFTRLQESRGRHNEENYRQEYRTGVGGYLGNKPWLSKDQNYKDLLDSVRRKFDNGYEWVAVQKAKQDMAPLVEAQTRGDINQGLAIRVGHQYFDHAFGRDQSTNMLTRLNDAIEERLPSYNNVRRAFRQFDRVSNMIMIPWMLAVKGTQAFQQLVQPFQAVLPKMTEFASSGHATYASIIPAFAKGSFDGMLELGRPFGLPVEKLKSYDAIGTAIEKAIQEQDITRISLVDTHNLMKEVGFKSALVNQGWDTLFGAPMRIFEAPVRATAFSSYVRQLVESGKSIEDAIKIAHESMDTVVNYNPEAQAQVFPQMGSLGREARGLHSFTINWFTQLARYLHNAKEQGQYVPAAVFLMNALVLTGVSGFIGADLVEKTIDILKSQLRGTSLDSVALQQFSFKQFLKEHTGSTYLNKGIPEASTGLSLSNSMATKVVDPDNSILNNLFPVSFAKGKLIANSFDLVMKMVKDGATDSEIGDALMKVAPSAYKELIREKTNVVGNDIVNGKGERVYRRDEFDKKVAHWGMGLRSAKEIENISDQYDFKTIEKGISDSRKAQIDKFDNLMNDAFVRGRLDKAEFKKQYVKLVEDWAVEPEKLNSFIQARAEDAGKVGIFERAIPKDINYGNVRKAQEAFKHIKETAARRKQ